MSIAIRPLTPDDVAPIVALAARIWHACYPGIISVEQIDYMLRERYNTARLLEELDQVGMHWDLVEEDGQLVGFASYFLSGVPGEMKLDKLYIAPERQRHGLGGILLTHVADQARTQGCSTLVLAVNKRNAPALAAYRQHGFVERQAVTVDIGGGFVMDDYIMAKNL